MKRKTAFGTGLLLLLLAALLFSCLEEPEPYTDEPAVAVKFFNIDSLNKTTAQSAAIDVSLAALNTTKTTATAALKVLTDSLTEINTLIAAGSTDLDDEKASVETQITGAQAEIATLTTDIATLTAEKTRLTKIIATINRGEVLLSRIAANGNQITYTDSAAIWYLPLNMNTSSQVYYITLGSRTDSLELTYGLAEELTERNYIKLIGTGIARTANYSFDSVVVYCPSLPEPCTSNETTVNIYF